MTIWSRQQVMEIWERGAKRHALDRALLLAATDRPAHQLQQLADLPLGELQQIVLAVRCANLGRRLPSYVDCPACGTRLEFTLDGDALRSDPPPGRIDVNGLCVRPPTSRDLALALKQPDRDSAERSLAEQCVVRTDGGAERELTAHEIASIEAALADADGAADTVLHFSCDACGHAWRTTFDIAAYFWQEIDAHARRLLVDVHILARAYGWSEGAVLSLSDERRAAYIAMVMS